MGNTVIVGLQFGDEGKGKIVDTVSSKYDAVVRFQGGNNAGHTVVVDGVEYRLHHIPSGALRDKDVMLGPGMVIDPEVFFEELRSVNSSKVHVDSRTQVILPWHREEDGLMEKIKGTEHIGTTLRGIGPAYRDRAMRSGVRVMDLLDSQLFLRKLKYMESYKRPLFEKYGTHLSPIEEFYETYVEFGAKFREYVVDVPYRLYELMYAGKNVLLSLIHI